MQLAYKFDPRKKLRWLYTNDFIKSLNLSSTKTIIGNRQIYTASMGEGKTAVEKQKSGNAVEEIKKLSEQILSEVK